MDLVDVRPTEKFAVFCLKTSGDNKSVASSASTDKVVVPEAPGAAAPMTQEEKNHQLMEEELERRRTAARNNKKAARSQIVFDVKPWEPETDLEELATEIRKIEHEGLTWGEGINIVPLAFGVKKLQVSCNVVDDLVQTELLVEKIEELEDYVQSVDIFSFNKL